MDATLNYALEFLSSEIFEKGISVDLILTQFSYYDDESILWLFISLLMAKIIVRDQVYCPTKKEDQIY